MYVRTRGFGGMCLLFSIKTKQQQQFTVTPMRQWPYNQMSPGTSFLDSSSTRRSFYFWLQYGRSYGCCTNRQEVVHNTPFFSSSLFSLLLLLLVRFSRLVERISPSFLTRHLVPLFFSLSLMRREEESILLFGWVASYIKPTLQFSKQKNK